MRTGRHTPLRVYSRNLNLNRLYDLENIFIHSEIARSMAIIGNRLGVHRSRLRVRGRIGGFGSGSARS